MTTKIDIEYAARLDGLKKQLDSIPNLTRRMSQQIQREWKAGNRAAEAAAKQQARAFDKAKKSALDAIPGVRSLRDQFSGVSDVVGGLMGQIGPMTMAFAGFGVAALAAGKSLLDAGNAAAAWTRDITTMADQTGLTTDQLAALRVATERAQKEFAPAVSGLQKFTQVLTDAAIKGGKSAVFFRRLGVDVGDAERGVRGASSALEEVVWKLGEMTDATEKARIVSALFGSAAGADLVDALNRAGGSLDALTADAAAYGLTVDREAIRATEDYDDALGRLSLSFGTLKMTIGKQVLPVLADFTAGLAAVIDPTRTWGELIDHLTRGLTSMGAVLLRSLDVGAAAVDWSKLGEEIGTAANEAQKLAALPSDLFVGPILPDPGKTEASIKPMRRLVDTTRAAAEAYRQLARQLAGYNEVAKPDLAARREADLANAISEKVAALKLETNVMHELAEIRRDAVGDVVHNTAMATAAIGDLIGQQFAAEAERYRRGSQAQREALKKQFVAQKLAALATAKIQTAQAVLASVAALGATPAGIAASVLAGVVGATQIAAIAAAKQPKFHRGGMAPDETPAVLRAGESVLTPQATRRIGGEEGVRRANRGETPSPAASVVVVQLGHEVVGSAVERHLDRPDAPVRRAMRRGMPAGRRMAGGVV